MKNLEKKKKNLKLLSTLSNDTLQMLESFNKCNKQAKRFIRDLINTNPYFWDYGFLLDMEYSYLKAMRETLLKENLFVGVERECERIQTCLNLLDIIQNRKSATKIVFNKKKEDFIDKNKVVVFNHDYELKTYVNTRNGIRFVNVNYINNLSNVEGGKMLLADRLYEIKAWKLYHKMREYWMKNWWS